MSRDITIPQCCRWPNIHASWRIIADDASTVAEPTGPVFVRWRCQTCGRADSMYVEERDDATVGSKP